MTEGWPSQPAGDATTAGGWLARLKAAARRLETEIIALGLAARDPRTPWHAKASIVAVVAYALSPIDLIPDAIPVLGLLDELILLPGAIWLALRFVPQDVMTACRAHAANGGARLSAWFGRGGLLLIAALWLAAAVAVTWWV